MSAEDLFCFIDLVYGMSMVQRPLKFVQHHAYFEVRAKTYLTYF
jgi:hypothetical protein